MTNLIIHFAPIIILFSYAELLELKIPRLNRDDCDYCTMKTRARCFRKSDWCDSTTDCPDGKDEHYCNTVSPDCGSDHDSCYSGQCIPKSWVCDGQVDCKDDSDEDCVPGGGRLGNYPTEKLLFKKWALSQRSTAWAWEKDTPRAIVAMYLMNTSEYSSGNPISELAAKELEAQLSFDLFRNQTKTLEEGELALYLHAMLAICINPKHFHGLDLVSVLQNRISKSNFVRPITLLALCNTGHPIHQEYVNKLKNIISSKPNEPIWIDTKAIATMALICVAKQTNDHALNRTIFETLLGMKSFQQTDGSFGDARTSAVIMQALIGQNDYCGWDFAKALQYIIKQYRNDSNGMLTNSLIMPLLSRRSLLDLGEVDCTYKNRNNLRNITLRESLEQKLGEKIHVRYSVQIGDQADVSYTCTLRVPVNTTLFDVMRLASEMDKKYIFQWRRHHEKKYIYSINSIDNDPELRKYWMLYKKHHGEEPCLIHKDVADIYPEESEHYVYWYKTVLQ